MTNTWFTADLHFGHNAMAATGKGYRPFATVEEHDETLIENWNARVRAADTVWVLGDVGVGSDTYTLECVSRLKGVKHLIAGNHDTVWPGNRNAHTHQRTWLKFFESVQSFAKRRVGSGEYYMLSHFPYTGDRGRDRFTQYRLRDEGMWLLHGHVHDTWAERGRQINVGVDVRDWAPMPLEDVTRIFRSEN